jgi:hypothetical protein
MQDSVQEKAPSFVIYIEWSFFVYHPFYSIYSNDAKKLELVGVFYWGIEYTE